MRISSIKNQEQWAKRDNLIAGSCHLFGKRRELYCSDWPADYQKAKGAHVWANQRKYLDFTMNGIGCSILGYAPKSVTKAVKKAADSGNMSTINSNIEVELAEHLLHLHPWADKARFSRSGGEMASIAIRIGRASSGRTKVLVFGYHGWHDWYLAASIKNKCALDNFLLPNIPNAGVPKELSSSVEALPSLTLLQLQKSCQDGELPGVLIIEIGRQNTPDKIELSNIVNFCRQNNIFVVFDEITSGFRKCLGGMHLIENIYPDAVLYGKTLSSGFPFSALIGTNEFFSGFPKTFVSSVYWTDRIGPSAALATLKEMERIGDRLFSHLNMIGTLYKSSLSHCFSTKSILINTSNLPELLSFSFPGYKDFILDTYLTEKFFDEGILFSSRFYPTYSHNKQHIKIFEKILTKILNKLDNNPSPSSIADKINGCLKNTSL